MINVIKYDSPSLPSHRIGAEHIWQQGDMLLMLKSNSSKMDLASPVLQRRLLQATATQITLTSQSPRSGKGGKQNKTMSHQLWSPVHSPSVCISDCRCASIQGRFGSFRRIVQILDTNLEKSFILNNTFSIFQCS